MVKVRMLADARGANEGHTVLTYRSGETYEISRDLAVCFIEDEVAVELEVEHKPISKKQKAAATLPGIKN